MPKKYRGKVYWFEDNTFDNLNNYLIKFFLKTKQDLFIFKLPRILSNNKISIKKYNFKNRVNNRFLFGRLIFFKFNLSILYFNTFKYELNFCYNKLLMDIICISEKHKVLLFLGYIKLIFFVFPIFY
jgi:hypothetical protein